MDTNPRKMIPRPGPPSCWRTRTLLRFVLAVGVALAAGSIQAEPPSADTLLERAIGYHDPENRFLTQAHRLVFAESRPDEPDRRTEVLIDVAGERFEIERGGEHTVAGVWSPQRCEMTLDGRSEVTDAEREEHHLTCERLTLLRITTPTSGACP